MFLFWFCSVFLLDTFFVPPHRYYPVYFPCCIVSVSGCPGCLFAWCSTSPYTVGLQSLFPPFGEFTINCLFNDYVLSFKLQSRPIYPYFLRFEVLKISIVVFWVVTSYGLVGVYRRFGGTYACIFSTELALKFWRWRLLVPPKRRLSTLSTLKMETTRSSESLVSHLQFYTESQPRRTQ
jgi:hypothetical protein